MPRDGSADETSAALTLVSPEPRSKAHRLRIRSAEAASEVAAPAITKAQRKRTKRDRVMLTYISGLTSSPMKSLRSQHDVTLDRDYELREGTRCDPIASVRPAGSKKILWRLCDSHSYVATLC